MKRPTPAVAIAKRERATENFKNKLKVLEELVEKNGLSKYPKRSSISAFANWVDGDLQVESISRDVIYNKEDEEYLRLQAEMRHLLKLVDKARTKGSKKKNAEENMRDRVNQAEERAQAYVNQYATVVAELGEAKKEIERLNIRLSRLTAGKAKLHPLRAVSTSENPIE